VRELWAHSDDESDQDDHKEVLPKDVGAVVEDLVRAGHGADSGREQREACHDQELRRPDPAQRREQPREQGLRVEEREARVVLGPGDAADLPAGAALEDPDLLQLAEEGDERVRLGGTTGSSGFVRDVSL
jgi:hypothetical protein